MSLDDNIFSSQQLSHISNYSGIFQTGVGYKKFDFVYNTGDGKFYYAREDMEYGGGADIYDNDRLSLIPDGPFTSEGQSYYILDTFNDLNSLGSDFKEGQIVNLQYSTGDSDGLYKIVEIQENVTALNNDPTLTGSAMNVVGVNSSEINNFEPAGPNQLKLSVVNMSPAENDNLWTADKFFFDADFGSSASFKCNNYKFEYGNGYYIMQPKNINSLTFEVDMTFKNRSNREANAIIHFLENHQGQLESESASPNLKYSQGISGFRWDGASTFHPYDSNEIQTKTFYCNDFSHSLNFENNNDITLKLRNLDTSLLRKSEQMFSNKADDYDPSVYYEENDVVFATGNHKYYYCKQDSVNKAPVQENEEWSRESGVYQDINTDYWTREFFWKPSIGLDVTQKPRTQELSLGPGYSQIYKDGINESLLTLNLQFNNRNDFEAYAIIHFLEQHYGAIPFLFSAPAPYEKPQNFICQEWTHNYNYKNNHSISVKFEQYPFDYTAQQYDNPSAPPPKKDSELVFSNPFVMSAENVGSTIFAGDKLKKRLVLKNIGDFTLAISSISITSNDPNVTFSKVSNDNYVALNNLHRHSYIFELPSSPALPFNLNGKTIKMSKSYSEGPEGGHTFVVMREENGQYVPDGFGAANYYFQNNKGQIKSANSLYQDCDYFIVQKFFENNGVNYIDAKSEAYIDIVCDSSSSVNEGNYSAQIEIINNGVFTNSSGKIKIYLV